MAKKSLNAVFLNYLLSLLLSLFFFSNHKLQWFLIFSELMTFFWFSNLKLKRGMSYGSH